MRQYTSYRRAALGRESDRLLRELMTPEGIPLKLHLADEGERAVAFVTDVLILSGVIILLTLIFALGFASGRLSGWATSFILLTSFFIRNFYFIFFEIRWQGATPGKRMRGLRVIDRRGGPLSSEAVVARNLVRDVEVFIPLSVLFAPQFAGASLWFNLVTLAWVCIFALMPLFNRDRLRVGDLVGGTVVVQVPRRVLLSDLAPWTAAEAESGETEGAEYTFTDAQLDVYGIYELQTLEHVLRATERTSSSRAAEEVCERIKRKIQWDHARWQVDTHRFLHDFYTALRARLEGEMLFGRRREDKYAGEGRRPEGHDHESWP